ncbi:DUF1289 domain-containing protein [Aurantivibrio plasticivorans]
MHRLDDNSNVVHHFMSAPVKTPCIGICSTAIGDEVCRGCKRFTGEVIHWNGYSNAEKQAVVDRLNALLIQVLQRKFCIFDEALLKEQIQFQQIRCDFTKVPYWWVFELIRTGAGQITDLSLFGVRLEQEYQHASLVDLKQQIDNEFYELSCAYYERYVVPGQTV